MTTIEWTAYVAPDGAVTRGESWNPLRAVADDGAVRGWACVKVAAECAACYADELNTNKGPRGGNGRPYLPGQHAPPLLDPARLEEPAHWRRPRRVFVVSMSDLFWEAVPDAWIAAVFATMAAAPRHNYLLLTKRAERAAGFVAGWLAAHGRAALPDHIWVGATAGTRISAEKQLPHLLRVPAAVRFVSCEPLLTPVDLRP